MKITDVQVVDPRQKGIFEDPFIQIYVDQEVEEIADPIFDYKKVLQYRIIPCGPFFAIEYRPDNGMSYSPWVDWIDHKGADLGEVNKHGLIKDQLFPVLVDTPGDVGLPLAMPVQRVRRLLRKHGSGWGSEWKLIVDQEAALLGLLKWRLERVAPMCYGGAIPRSDHCLDIPIKTLVYRNTHLPLCPIHLRRYEAQLRSARHSAPSPR